MRAQLFGSANPNYRGAGRKVCAQCGRGFVHYGRTRRYCTLECYWASPASTETARRNGRLTQGRPRTLRVCPQCGNVFWSPTRAKYCSGACVMRGRHGRIDGNQGAIVDALRAVGAGVIVTSAIGGGFPDLVVGHHGRNYLMEVKNPENRYGRKGFAKSQKEFSEWWPGAIYLVRSVDEALSVLRGPVILAAEMAR